MKKSTVMITALLATLSAVQPALAAVPVASHLFRFECPKISGGVSSEKLTNTGTSVFGMGEENIDGSKVMLPIFRGKSTPGIPLDLATGNYTRYQVLYNPHTGRVSCLFNSSNGADNFKVSYAAENLKHGAIIKSDNAAITIQIFQGVKS